MARPIQIFKAGSHTDMSGRTISFTTSDIARTARAYDPVKHEAPLVVGHPATDDPAYGLVASLQTNGDALEAIPYQIDQAFAEMVNAGRFSKISASFFLPTAPGNPVPGVYYLRHIGFLGAAAPAVKGLRRPQFAASEIGIVAFIEDQRMTIPWQTHSPDPALVERYARDLQATSASMGKPLNFADAKADAIDRLTQAAQENRNTRSQTSREADSDTIERLAKVLQQIAQRDGKPITWDEAQTQARQKMAELQRNQPND